MSETMLGCRICGKKRVVSENTRSYICWRCLLKENGVHIFGEDEIEDQIFLGEKKVYIGVEDTDWL